MREKNLTVGETIIAIKEQLVKFRKKIFYIYNV